MTSPLPDHLQVRPISASAHLGFIESRPSVSFLQTPAWARVKSEWEHESLGWFSGDTLVGAGLVLYRQLPRVKRYLAYLPEGPVIDWETEDLGAWLRPLAAHLKRRKAFGVRIGPPVVVRRWGAARIKEGIADAGVRRLTELAPDERSQSGARVLSQLHELGWRAPSESGGFAAGQPRFNFQVPLPEQGTAEEREAAVLRAMNQQWRRNIKKSGKAGVEVTRVSGSITDIELTAFHDLYVTTAQRDGFTPRPVGYFRTMLDSLGAEAPDRIWTYFARHEGDLVASTIWIRVGAHTWYSYGASSTEKREVRGSNAVQWQMIRDAIAADARIYDLRGITDTVDAEDPHVGLIQFKVGTGGEAVEYAGEWDLPLNTVLYRAFEFYMSRRG